MGKINLDPKLTDKVQHNSPGSREIGFILPDRYNASAILFDNFKSGRGNRIALFNRIKTANIHLCQQTGAWTGEDDILGTRLTDHRGRADPIQPEHHHSHDTEQKHDDRQNDLSKILPFLFGRYGDGMFVAHVLDL